MLARRLGARLLVTVVVATIAVVSTVATAGEWMASKEVQEVRSRITALRQTRGLSKGERQSHLEQLDAVGREIEQRWRKTDLETYGHLIVDTCGTLTGLGSVGMRGQYMAQSLAMRALEEADDMPLELECRLVGFVQQEADAEGKALPNEAKAKAELRKRQALIWLHAWQSIEKTIDKTWDPKDVGTSTVMPPAGTGLALGGDPKAIADPKLRAQYEAAIEANRQTSAKAILQIRARQLMKYWIPSAKRFLIRTYTEAPDRMDELQTLLEQYVTDADSRTEILDAVRNKKMPESLLPRTTQPAQTQPAQ